MKKVLYFVAAFVCLFSSAYAYEPVYIHLENHSVEDENVAVYFNTNVEIAPNQLSVTLDNQPLVINSVECFYDADQGVSLMFLVDVSGSISKSKLSKMKDIMNRFAESMGAKDNACIMTVGNSASISPFVSDKDQLLQQISSLERTSEKTNLFASIVKAVDTLNTFSSVQTKRCLIILTDGQDYYATGYTREEVTDKIEKANLPVYTIAMLDKKSDKKKIESAKILGSFARISAGGLDLTHGLDDVTEQDIYDRIFESINNSYILHANYSSMTDMKDPGYLQIHLTVEGRGQASDGYEISTSVMQSQISAKPSASPSPSPTQSETEPESVIHESEETKADNTWQIIISAVAVLVIAAIVIVIVVNKRNNAHASKEPQDASIISTGNQTTNCKSEIDMIVLELTRVGINENESYKYELIDQMIMGRSSAKSQLVFAQDTLLSGQHCRIYISNNKLYIEDLNSTNGTYLNGVPVKEPHMLEQDDIILIGSMELRVNWK